MTPNEHLAAWANIGFWTILLGLWWYFHPSRRLTRMRCRLVAWTCDACPAHEAIALPPHWYSRGQARLLRDAEEHRKACGRPIGFAAILWNSYTAAESSYSVLGRSTTTYSRDFRVEPVVLEGAALEAFRSASEGVREEILRASVRQAANAEDEAMGAKRCLRCGIKIMPGGTNARFDAGYCGEKCWDLAQRRVKG